VRLLIVAGEASGDLHAANLVAALRRQVGTLEAFGVGGERMREVGVECLARAEDLSVMGLVEVVRELPRLVALSRRVRRQALERHPDVAVLVDSPDFNLRLAQHLRRAGVPVVIYVSPQLWAWRSGRVRTIRRNVAQVLCILPFEVAFYQRHGVRASYVGHPLLDELRETEGGKPTPQAGSVALLPGSRWHEVASLLPTMLAACRRVLGEGEALSVRLLAAPGLEVVRLRALVADAGFPVEIVEKGRRQVLATCAAALVASGTATLECAILGVPMAVCYRLHPASYLLARLLVRVPFVSLVNLVAQEAVVPEFIQSRVTAEGLAAALRGLLGEAGEQQRRLLAGVRQRLGEAGASDRAAAAVLEVAQRGSPAA